MRAGALRPAFGRRSSRQCDVAHPLLRLAEERASTWCEGSALIGSFRGPLRGKGASVAGTGGGILFRRRSMSAWGPEQPVAQSIERRSALRPQRPVQGRVASLLAAPLLHRRLRRPLSVSEQVCLVPPALGLQGLDRPPPPRTSPTHKGKGGGLWVAASTETALASNQFGTVPTTSCGVFDNELGDFGQIGARFAQRWAGFHQMSTECGLLLAGITWASPKFGAVSACHLIACEAFLLEAFRNDVPLPIRPNWPNPNSYCPSPTEHTERRPNPWHVGIIQANV